MWSDYLTVHHRCDRRWQTLDTDATTLSWVEFRQRNIYFIMSPPFQKVDNASLGHLLLCQKVCSAREPRSCRYHMQRDHVIPEFFDNMCMVAAYRIKIMTTHEYDILTLLQYSGEQLHSFVQKNNFPTAWAVQTIACCTSRTKAPAGGSHVAYKLNTTTKEI